LLFTLDIDPGDHLTLIANSDVYLFPADLDTPVDDPGVDVFFEAIYIPTNWLTPATTWRELLRQLAGMFQFNQRYGGIAAQQTGELHSIFDTAGLDTRLNQMTAQEQVWFQMTIDSFTEQFGLDPITAPGNQQLRNLVKTAGSFWDNLPFFLGGTEF
jgi:hypothetical protein